MRTEPVSHPDPGLARYQRQMIFPGIGRQGQERLQAARVVLVGCGATGSHLAEMMARSGVGHLRIVDRDFVELTNLQRQTLFDEQDVAESLPKAVAAARKLARINSQIQVEPVVADVNPDNVLELLADATLVLDGTDNFVTRYLLNDACTRLTLPWIYTGVVASHGMTATLIPTGAEARLPGSRSATPCLRCLLGEIPAPGTTETCDTVGVVMPAVATLTGIAAAEALKLLVGTGDLNPGIVYVDLWDHTYRLWQAPSRRPDCPVCTRRRFQFLEAQEGTVTTTLCGRNAVQIRVRGRPTLDLEHLAQRLAPVADRVRRNEYLLKAQVDGYEITVFPDGRAIVLGTEDPGVARSLYDRYIGS